ncbi:glycine/betaine ABC transporter permease [Yersinia enterocolitica]|nr:glycine/betaine ABC transporter permease [Yersinia enterocolitica]
MATLGWEGTGSFIYESLQSWDSGLIFIASILILLLEMVCGVAVCLRQNWVRWCYVACQLLVVVYLLMASLDWLVLDVDVFRIEGDTGAEILHSLLLQKIPDVVILGLLFFPWHRYFRSSK